MHRKFYFDFVSIFEHISIIDDTDTRDFKVNKKWYYLVLYKEVILLIFLSSFGIMCLENWSGVFTSLTNRVEAQITIDNRLFDVYVFLC